MALGVQHTPDVEHTPGVEHTTGVEHSGVDPLKADKLKDLALGLRRSGGGLEDTLRALEAWADCLWRAGADAAEADEANLMVADACNELALVRQTSTPSAEDHARVVTAFPFLS